MMKAFILEAFSELQNRNNCHNTEKYQNAVGVTIYILLVVIEKIAKERWINYIRKKAN